MRVRADLIAFGLFLIILPFPRTVAARLLLLAICFGVALWQWLRQAPTARAIFPCKAVLGAWIVVCLASLGYAANVGYTAGELKNEIGYTMMAFFAFFVVAKDRETALLLVRALAIGLVILGVWAIVGWALRGFAWNESGRHGGAGTVATYVATILPALVWLAMTDPSRGWRRTAVMAVLIAAFAGVITVQRALWPVIAVEALILLVVSVPRGQARTDRRKVMAVVMVVIAVGLGGALLSQKQRFGTSESLQAQLRADTRLDFWPAVIQKIGQHPLSGAGFGRDAMAEAYPDLVPADNRELWHAHNVFLNYGIGMGVPGMLAISAVFACWGMFFWRSASGTARIACAAGLAMVVGVVLRNQFNDFFVRDMSLLFWALLGLFARLTVAAAGEVASTRRNELGN